MTFGGLKGLRLDGAGSLWGLDGDTNSLWKIDVTTGDRTRVSSTDSGHPVGHGDATLGLYGLALGARAADPIWTVGTWSGDGSGTGALTKVDPAMGDRSGPGAADLYGPASGDASAVWHHPTAPWLILSGPSFGVVLFDPQTNNSNYLSNG
jgi:hypothetical protein